MSPVADPPYDNSYDCNGTGAQQWSLNAGTTAVQVANTNFCLDAGSGEHDRSIFDIESCC